MPSNAVSVWVMMRFRSHTGAPCVDGGPVTATVVGAAVVGTVVTASVVTDAVAGTVVAVVVADPTVVADPVTVDPVDAFVVAEPLVPDDVPPEAPGNVLIDKVPAGFVVDAGAEDAAPGPSVVDGWNVTGDPSGETTPTLPAEAGPDVSASPLSEPHAASTSTALASSNEARVMTGRVLGARLCSRAQPRRTLPGMVTVAHHRGIREDGVTALSERVQREIDAGRITAAQFAIARDGEVLATRAFGAATPDSRFVIFSATKALVAMALLPHLEDGSLELTAKVASIIPGFGEHGKGEVTVLQLLTMQGGFPWAPIGPKQWRTSAGRREAFASWHLDWPAGTRTEYHPLSAHWVIAELIEALNERPYADVVHERITAPAGVDRLLGAAPGGGVGSPHGPVVPVRAIGEHPGADDPRLIEAFGRPELVPKVVIELDQLLFLNDPRSQAAAIPGGGAIAHATDIVRVYQSFLRNDTPWQRDAICTIRNGSLSATDGLPANRTIAGVVAGHDGYHDLRWFPAAPRAFGHHGAGGQLCWLEPDSGMSFCFLHDTLDQDPGAELLRCREINALALACARH